MEANYSSFSPYISKKPSKGLYKKVKALKRMVTSKLSHLNIKNCNNNNHVENIFKNNLKKNQINESRRNSLEPEIYSTFGKILLDKIQRENGDKFLKDIKSKKNRSKSLINNNKRKIQKEIYNNLNEEKVSQLSKTNNRGLSYIKSLKSEDVIYQSVNNDKHHDKAKFQESNNNSNSNKNMKNHLAVISRKHFLTNKDKDLVLPKVTVPRLFPKSNFGFIQRKYMSNNFNNLLGFQIKDCFDQLFEKYSTNSNTSKNAKNVRFEIL